MAVTAETLQVVISGSMQGLASAYTQAAKATESFTKGISGAMGQVRSGINAVGTAALKLAAPIAAAGGAFLSFKTVMDSLNRADGLARTAAELGVTTDALQKLGHAASLSGSSAAEVTDAMRFMSRFIGQAAEEGSQAAKTMEKLGVNFRQLEGMSADEAFMHMADALNSVTDQGQRATMMQEVFGRGAKNVALMVAGGSEEMRKLGEDAERTGKVLSGFELGQLVAAKGAIEELQTTFQALGDRLAVAFAPVIKWLSDAINGWIGNAKDFDATMQSVAEGFVSAVGVMRLAWQGLQLMWEGAKVVVGGLSVAVWEMARDVTKAAMWIGDVFSDTWDWIKASFNVTGSAIVLGWEWIKSKAIAAFAIIGESFAKTIIAMGAAARGSGIKGLSDIGWQAEVAGTDLLVGAMRLRQGADAGVAAATASLDQSVQNLEAARAAMSAPADLATPWLDQMTENAQTFFSTAKQGFTDLAAQMASQEGGNAFTATWASFRKSQDEAQAQALESAAAFNQERAVVSAEGEQMVQDAIAKVQMTSEEKKAAWIADYVKNTEEQNYNERMKWAGMWESGMQGKLEVISSMLSGFAALMQSKNKAMFQVGKAAAMAETVVNTFLSAQLAYTRALEIPGIGLALAPIAAASAIAGGLMRLQQIASTQFGSQSAPGGGGGAGATGSMTGAGAAKEAAEASSQSNVNVTLYGSTFSADQVRGLVGAINDQVGDNLNLKAQVA